MELHRRQKPSSPNEQQDEHRVPGLDEQFSQLIEVVWKCERRWAFEDRLDSAIKYGREAR